MEGTNDEKGNGNVRGYKSNPVCDADIVQCIGESGEKSVVSKSS